MSATQSRGLRARWLARGAGAAVAVLAVAAGWAWTQMAAPTGQNFPVAKVLSLRTTPSAPVAPLAAPRETAPVAPPPTPQNVVPAVPGRPASLVPVFADAAKQTPAIKLEDGKVMSIPGKRLNIIPMLKDTDPTDQLHIRTWLQNGDVLQYFHPENKDTRSLMDRRASHVAMYYDYKRADGQEFVHHIDNPNSYGPQFNHAP